MIDRKSDDAGDGAGTGCKQNDRRQGWRFGCTLAAGDIALSQVRAHHRKTHPHQNETTSDAEGVERDAESFEYPKSIDRGQR